MKNYFQLFKDRFEAMAMAVAYAEAGEWGTANEIMDFDKKAIAKKPEKRKSDKPRKQNRMRAY